MMMNKKNMQHFWKFVVALVAICMLIAIAPWRAGYAVDGLEPRITMPAMVTPSPITPPPSVTLPSPTPLHTHPPILFAETASGQPGDTVRSRIILVANPGIAGFNITVTYDNSVLTPNPINDATARTALGGMVFVSSIDHEAGTISVVWASAYELPSMPPVWVAENHYRIPHIELFPIYFTINENVQVSPGTPLRSYLSITASEMKRLNHRDVDVNLNSAALNGLIIISAPPEGGEPTPSPSPGNGGPTPTPSPGNDDPLWGDVNQDGVVDILDLIRLAQHIANTPGMQLTGVGLTVADVFYDGDVNLSDLIHLARYLASTDMNNPDVILGPTP